LPARFVTLRNISTNILRLHVSAALLAGIVALLLSMWPIPVAAGDRVFTDSAGRRVELPARIERVFAAGPPAAVLLYSLAPERLVGWPQDLSAEAKRILPARYAALPVVGRLTGHENSVAVAAVAALRPDLIVDVGDIEPEYADLANRVQRESGIPYVLIDGSLAKTADAYRSLGSLLDAQPAADDLAKRAGALLDGVRATLAKVAGDGRLRAYYARGQDGLETAMPGSVLAEGIEFCGLALAAPPLRTASAPSCRSRKSPAWIRTSSSPPIGRCSRRSRRRRNGAALEPCASAASIFRRTLRSDGSIRRPASTA
jgi:iron complex transport system substrate-binding protein